jgi:phosphate transport system substrate-binding protein
MSVLKLTASSIAIAALSVSVAAARDQVQITGSSTVLPYATIVAEAFGENFDFPTPVVEGGGSGAGRQKMCLGVGANTVDIANSSSRISQKDLDTCAANGVNEVMEVRFGYDGIVFASAVDGPEFALTPTDVFNAIGAQVLKDGAIVANPNNTWKEVNAALPEQNILVLTPGTKHGTREVFDTRVIIKGCEESGAMKAMMDGGMDEDAAEEACAKLRTDGKSVDIDGDYTETLARLEADKSAIGVFGLSFYQNNTNKLRVATMNGVVPSAETIAKGEYPVSRPLFFYVKLAHIGVIPLAQYGLVSDPELAATQAMVAAGTPMGPLK